MVKDGSERAADWIPKELGTSTVALRPPVVDDYEFLRVAEIMWLGPRWRHRGVVASPEDYGRYLWAGVLSQYLVVRRRDYERLGIVSLFNADTQNGHAEVSVARFSKTPSRDFLEAVAGFLDHVFDNWPFRKLYFHVAEFNLSQLSSGIGHYFQIEGRLLDYIWAGDRYYDLVIMAMDRAAWTSR